MPSKKQKAAPNGRIVASVNFDPDNRDWLIEQKAKTRLSISHFVNLAIAEYRRRRGQRAGFSH
jgi:hypothetical protein